MDSRKEIGSFREFFVRMPYRMRQSLFYEVAMEKERMISTEKKLQLVRLLRSEDAHNRMKMRSREELLYGRSSCPAAELDYIQEAGPGDETPAFSSLRFRFVLAFALLVGFVAWDNGYYPVPGLAPEQVYECLSEENSISNLFAFMEEISYTLESNE